MKSGWIDRFAILVALAQQAGKLATSVSCNGPSRLKVKGLCLRAGGRARDQSQDRQGTASLSSFPDQTLAIRRRGDRIRDVDVASWPMLLKKSEYRRPDFFSAVGAVFRCGRGGPHHPPQTNGASSKSICGGNYRQSKMSLVFWQICNDFRLATFSTESAQKRQMLCCNKMSAHKATTDIKCGVIGRIA